MRQYRISYTKELLSLEDFVNMDLHHDCLLSIEGRKIVRVGVCGKTLYFICLTTCNVEKVLPLVFKFIKLWNTSFVSRKKNRGRFTNKTSATKRPATKRRYIINIKRKYQTYDEFAKTHSAFAHKIHYRNNMALVYSRLRGRTLHFYVVRGEGWLDAHSIICQVISEYNQKILEKRRKKAA